MKQSVVALFVVLSWFSSFATHAGIITFTDRALFQSYINDFVLDEFNEITLATSYDISRTGYNWTMPGYGCVNSFGCNYYGSANPFLSPGNSWIWTQGSGQFNFDFAITAFGFDYVNPFYASNAQLGLNGLLSGMQPNGSFFGIATTDGSYLPGVIYQQKSPYMGFDNLTYSTTANGESTQIPEPWPLALLAVGLLLLARHSRRKARAGV